MDTKVYGNKRRTIWVALASGNPFADQNKVKASEVNAMLKISSVVKFDSTDIGIQASDKIDDRTLTDAASARRRGFVQFGGAVNILTPKDLNDITDIALKAFNLFKTPRTPLWIADRIGPLNSTDAQPGERVHIYRVANDAKKNHTSGDTSYSYTEKLIPQGDVYPQQVLAADAPVKVLTSGFETTLNLGSKAYTWGLATLSGTPITTSATWTSSSPAVATVDSRGLVTALSAGSTNIVASYGDSVSDPIAITVSAS